ncbi:Phospholipase A1-II 7 [Triticum urartu]|uniref:Phospholipase A1 n=1 Tax=Triticum urartu TaxID=4572 RepID=M7YUB9_TRIUA|nr:Phospholipase A1-II 7 [Triticum urartu]
MTHPEYYKVTKFLYATCGGSTASWLATSMPTVTNALFVQPLGKAEGTPTSNWMGYVAVATDEGVAALGRRDIVVVWRGTENELEWEKDKHFLQVPAAPVLGRYADGEHKNSKVHRGFLSVYTSSDNNSMYNKTSAREQVLEEVGRLMEEYKDEVTSITVTGHSLGASLATLTAIDMVANDVNVPPASKQPPCPVTAILLACPRVGNPFPLLRALHVANAKDIVPQNPPSMLLMWYVDSATATILYLHGVAGDHGDNEDFKLVVPRDVALVNKTTDLLEDEYPVPASWWVVNKKCMVKGTDGQWKLDDFEEA